MLLFQFHSIQFWMELFLYYLFLFLFILLLEVLEKGIQTLQEDDLLEEVKSFPVWKSTTCCY